MAQVYGRLCREEAGHRDRVKLRKAVRCNIFKSLQIKIFCNMDNIDCAGSSFEPESLPGKGK